MRDDERQGGEERWLLDLVEELRQPLPVSPAARERLARALASEPPARRRWTARVTRAAGWLTRPREMRISPLAGLATAAGVAAVLALALAGLRPGATGTVVPEGAGGPASPALVQFVLVAPGAATVSLVGDFNDWREGATEMLKAGEDGLWTVQLALEPGRHAYAFVVNGTEWVIDEHAPQAPENEFGVPNSIIVVTGKERSWQQEA